MDLLTTEIGWVLLAQDYLGGLEPLMHAASALGIPFFFSVVAVIWWCANPQKGLRLGLLLTISGGINTAAKLFFHTPRPYWLSTEVRALAVEPTFSMPSGHAQNAVCFWGYAAALVRRWWFLALAGVLIVLTGVSRVVLGVHFPGDVIVGWALGAAILIAFLILEGPVGAWLGRRTRTEQFGVVCVASILLLAPSVIAVLFFRSPVFDALIPAGADPWNLSNALYASGAVLGLGAGAIWDGGRFSAGGAFRVRAVRLVVGCAGAFILWAATSLLILAVAGPLAQATVYLQAATLGLWVAGAAPRLFVRLGFAG